MDNPKIVIDLPQWLEPFLRRRGEVLETIAERMQLAIDLSRLNRQHQTGGPFGAAVFEEPSGRLLSVGVNLVTSTHCSVAHAEMVALILAQQARGCYDLGGPGSPPCQLVTSCEPCAMCLGAIPWSGIKSVVCGARGEDAESVGFDEGAKPADWVSALDRRGIAVTRDVLRLQARSVLLDYRQEGGVIY
jgi:tRNA(Arg) A34 adenosine deaminase TadA